jgi:hypothetical protein
VCVSSTIGDDHWQHVWTYVFALSLLASDLGRCVLPWTFSVILAISAMAADHSHPDLALVVAADGDAPNLQPYKDAPTLHSYKEGDNPLDGLACYIPGCKYKGYAWGLMLQHLRLRHNVSWASLEGTHLHKMGKEEINTYKRLSYEAKKKKQGTIHQEVEVKVEPKESPKVEPKESPKVEPKEEGFAEADEPPAKKRQEGHL